MGTLRVLTISGSLRQRSSNTELLRALELAAPDEVHIVRYGGLANLPHFNPDDDVEGAVLPGSVQELRGLVDSADIVVICSPEYAHGVPGSLKNALDWLVSGHEIPAKPVALLNASARSTHAQASLVETLRTMSAAVLPGSPLVIPLDGRRLDAAAIATDPALKPLLGQVTAQLRDAAAEYHAHRPSGRALAWPLRE